MGGKGPPGPRGLVMRRAHLGLFCGIKPPQQEERASLPFPSTLGPSEIPLWKYLNYYFPITCCIFAHHLAKGQLPALGGCRHPPQGWGRAGLLHAHRHCVLGRAWGHPQHWLHSSCSPWLHRHSRHTNMGHLFGTYLLTGQSRAKQNGPSLPGGWKRWFLSCLR